MTIDSKTISEFKESANATQALLALSLDGTLYYAERTSGGWWALINSGEMPQTFYRPQDVMKFVYEIRAVKAFCRLYLGIFAVAAAMHDPHTEQIIPDAEKAVEIATEEVRAAMEKAGLSEYELMRKVQTVYPDFGL